MILRLPAGRALAAVLACASLAACAHGAAPVAAVLPAEKPANARATLYASCAARAGGVATVGRYVRLTCEGAPAQALFDEAAVFSRSRGRETVEGAVTVRRIGAELWYDACRRDDAASPPTYRCFVHLLAPVDFLDPARDAATPPATR